MPRSGMESMATAFLLIPMIAVRAISVLIICIYAIKKRKSLIIAFSLLGLGICAVGFWYGMGMKPQHEPLYKVLKKSGSLKKNTVKQSYTQKKYHVKKVLQKKKDPLLGELCDLVEKSTANPGDITKLINSGADVNGLCHKLSGAKSSPLLHAMIGQYGEWQNKKGYADEADLTSLYLIAGELVKNGADLDLADDLGNTPLHYAAYHGDEKLVSLFLKAGACIYLENTNRVSPFSMSSRGKLRKIMRRAAEDPEMISKCPSLFREQKVPSVSQEGKYGDGSSSSQIAPRRLEKAIRGGNLQEAGSLLGKGVDPNGIIQGGTFTHIALERCRDGVLAMIELLIEAGADLELKNKKGQTPLSYSVYNCFDAVPYLLDKGADPFTLDMYGETLLHKLAKRSYTQFTQVYQKVIDTGADINKQDRNGRTALKLTAYAGKDRSRVAEKLLLSGADPDIQDINGDTLLHTLVADNTDKDDSFQFIKLLISFGSDVNLINNNGDSPLSLSTKYGKSDIADLLLTNGADPNLLGKHGEPLLVKAVSCDEGKVEILQLLVSHGADIDSHSTYGSTALVKALHSNTRCLEPARVLLESGADPNFVDRNGYLPLHKVVFRNHDDIGEAIGMLIQRGATVDSRDRQGNTPLLYAAKHSKSKTAVSALHGHGADVGVVDKRGNGLLHSVAMNSNSSNRSIYSYILTIINEPLTVNHQGLTPYDIAVKKQNHAMIDIFSQKKKK